ncbi:MAG: DEAD/DEAH box helicase family protein [Peptococcaceae bacterium]|jgi:type III restriction enzyme|nr:DEAD/DEAH box helicase family protein [Peptococcaceae bacterium]MDH7526257.1 DEAD/DEAH box helicase family protein [Peptococcaceae bacterium]
MSGQKVIDKLIINSPYEEPKFYWHYDRETRTFEKREGRRPAGYVVASESSKSFDDPGVFVPIKLVNEIRPRVKKWREEGYPGVTGITKRLLSYWNDPEERLDRRFFFCQLEAIETLIWLVEAPEAEKVGIHIPSDGGEFRRICSKMATGSGKTIVMSMLIAWQVLNKVSNPRDVRFSKNVLVVAPGLTVKSRLSVLNPSDINNYYEVFNIVPPGLMDSLRQGKILITNWHALAWEDEEKLKKKKSVDKRGAKSDEAYVREVLGDMANARNIIVINDEAHHAWRVNPELKAKREFKDQEAKATVWIGGLDRIHRARGIQCCFDLSATPFAPSGKKAQEEAIFGWIVSDFGLNDAIESGLVKTPRVVIRDDSVRTSELKSRLYHIYMDPDVKDDINRKAQETEPLPDLIINAYYLLGKDWLETKKEWEAASHKVPPVMITVANRTETSSRIRHAFLHNEIMIPELCVPEGILQIDSKVLDEAEASDEEITLDMDGYDEEDDNVSSKKMTKKLQAELLRKMVDTVGQAGKRGEKIQNVISVGMLSEGWDAKTVTHIMGLRAFSSQLLCEQVVGRGLRRVSYDIGPDGLFEPEYVNIFGVPFTFLPHEGGEGTPPPPPKPKTKIEPVQEKMEHEIVWPNVVRIDTVYRPKLTLDLDRVEPIVLDPYESITEAELAAIIAGKPNPAVLSDIDLKRIAEETRTQTIIFKMASKIYNIEQPAWKGSKELFLAQLIRIVGEFIESDRIVMLNERFSASDERRKVLIILNMNKIIQYIWNALKAENSEMRVPVFDNVNPIRSTSDMRAWYTSKPTEWTKKSHISHVVVDSTWEATEAYIIDKHPKVKSFVKNDHLGFYIVYNYQGVIRKYYPDFIIKLVNGEFLVLEVKGKEDAIAKTKHASLAEWAEAVNTHGGFGRWKWAVSYTPGDLEAILDVF